MRITVDADIDLNDVVRDWVNEIVDVLECYHDMYIFPYTTLNDRSKLEWFEAAKDKYSLEDFEEKFPI